MPSGVCTPFHLKSKSFSVPPAEVATALKKPSTVPVVVKDEPSYTSSSTRMPGMVSFMVSLSLPTAAFKSG